MERNRTVAGLDVHKDSIYLCIMSHDESIIFEKTYGQILTILQTKDEVNKLTDEQIELYCRDAETIAYKAEEICAPFRTYFPEDIDAFRKEYKHFLSLRSGIDAQPILAAFATKYTDEHILSLLKQGEDGHSCMAYDCQLLKENRSEK